MSFSGYRDGSLRLYCTNWLWVLNILIIMRTWFYKARENCVTAKNKTTNGLFAVCSPNPVLIVIYVFEEST